MLERRERVEQWARREEQGADSRSHARAGLGSEAVAGGSATAAEEEEYMRAAVYGGRFAVSSCLRPSCLARWERQLGAQCPSQRESAQLEAPRLSLNCRLVCTRPAFQLCCMSNFDSLNMFRDLQTLWQVHCRRTRMAAILRAMLPCVNML